MAWRRIFILAVIAGVALGVATTVRAIDAWLMSLALASLLVGADRAPYRRSLLAGLLATLATGHGATTRDRALSPPLARWLASQPADSLHRTPVMVEGTLLADAVNTDVGAQLLVQTRALHELGGATAIEGRVQLHVNGALVADRVDTWRKGRPIRAPAALRAPQVLRNPGGPSPAWQSLRRKFDIVGTVKSAALVETGRGRWWDEAAGSARAHVRRVADRFTSARDPPSAAIAKAILIGDRTGLDDDVERRLQVAGTYHLIAISGGNVALLTAISFFVFRLAARSFRLASGLGIVTVATYGWVAGGEPSVTRAVLAAVIYLSVGFIGLVPRALDVLVAVAAIVFVIDPLSAIDVGAWLSYGATLGIIVFAGRLVELGRSRGRTASGIPRRVGLAAVGVFAATLAAELTLLPVSATVFGRVGVAGLALNLIAVPAMAVVQVGGGTVLLFASWWSAGAAGAGALVDSATWVLVQSSRLVDVAPWVSWRVPAPAFGWIAGFYLSGALVLGPRARPALRRLGGVLALVCSAAIAAAPFAGHAAPRPPWLRLTMMDVGQGDALLLQFPAGQTLLIDAGGVPGTFDIGERIVRPAAAALGVRRADWLAVTHPDLDHIGGAASLMTVFRPREVWEGAPVPPNPARRALYDAAVARGLAWRALQRGDRLEVGGVTVSVLNPPLPDWERQRVRNDDSIVLDVRYADVELLLTGDIGQEVERAIASDEDRGWLRVLKVAHHGSRTSSSAAFLQAFAPHVALVSAGQGNLFGHPAPDVLERLGRRGAAIFRTDLDGAIVVETDGRELRVKTMTGRTWLVRRSRF